MKVALSLVLLTGLAACDAPSAPADPPVAPAAPVAPAPPEPSHAPTPSVAASTILSGLSRADFEGRLQNGAGCTLSRDGADLVVAVIGDAVAKVGGKVFDLTGAPLAEISALARGGRLEGAGTVIKIDAAPDLGAPTAGPESSLARPVRVTVTSSEQRETFEAVWTCAS